MRPIPNFHGEPEKTSSLIKYIYLCLNRQLLGNVVTDVITQTLIIIPKTTESLITAFYEIKLWHFSQEFHDIVAIIWYLIKMTDKNQVISCAFL